MNSKFGIELFDSAAPEGFPRESFILLFGEGGTGKSVTLLQIAGSKLMAGEPCVFVTFDDSPSSLVENFKRFNSGEPIEKGLLTIVDGFSFRSKMPQKTNSYIKYVENPRDRQSLNNVLFSAIDRLNGKGAVFIDSITELFTMSEPTSTIETIKDWRAQLSKARGLPVFASHHLGVRAIDEFAGMLEYVVDCVIDFRFDPVFAQQGLLARQFRVKKLKGATHDTLWHYFTIDKNGIQPIRAQPHRAPKEDAQRLSK